MNKDQLERFILALEHVRQRPYMYIASTQNRKNPAENWLCGIDFALFQLGLKKILLIDQESGSIWKDVVTERGWEWSNTSPGYQIESSGLSEEEMIKELLTIQIEVWKRTLDLLNNQEDNTTE